MNRFLATFLDSIATGIGLAFGFWIIIHLLHMQVIIG